MKTTIRIRKDENHPWAKNAGIYAAFRIEDGAESPLYVRGWDIEQVKRGCRRELEGELEYV